ncbi:MAG TPA: type II toxin-antitoxin system Phd/YefM family antitoxin [Spirochaetales bacterium]|nr:type II toxin-antitoxin system Phd/YefM family antitoxin [Spirochaetales bacterium]
MLNRQWTAAEAKQRFSDLLDASGTEPQLILRHGKPAGVLVNWQLFEANSRAFKPGLVSYLDELADINLREGDFELLPRTNRFDNSPDFS